MLHVCGSNIFGQWFLSESIITKIQPLNYDHITKSFQKLNITNPFQPQEIQLVNVGWSCNIFQLKDSYFLSGSCHGNENQLSEILLPDECKGRRLKLFSNDSHICAVDVGEKIIWLLSLENETDFKRFQLDTISLLVNPEGNATKRIKRNDDVIKIVGNNHMCVLLTAQGTVYLGFVPIIMETGHCYGQVIDIQCGYEHCLLLTDAGRVYSWGNGRRLQLGHGDIHNIELPLEIEALAGIKISKISAGGWHSLALSEFGDLYAWGWNDTGQLGIKEKPNQSSCGVLRNGGIKCYPLPTLIDFYDGDKEIELTVKDIACGSRHSAVILEDDSLWTSGYNKYGQLGLCPKTYPNVDFFVKTFQCNCNPKLLGGLWCTVIM